MRTTLLLAILITTTLSAAASADSTPPDDAAAAARRTELRSALARQRAVNLARFHEYRKKRIYPHNSYEPDVRNVWLDADGHLCAVATLMKRAGLDDLVETTGRAHNFVKVADLTDGPLVDWVLTSGLTQEEVVMIQQPTQADVEEMEAQYRAEERKLARKLAREDRRLAHNYLITERALATPLMTEAALDLAAARLAQHPALAATVLASAHAAHD